MNTAQGPVALDVASLPRSAFGQRSVMWWATMCMIAIEGTAFALAITSYLYLKGRTPTWPPAMLPPALLWGTINLVVLLVSAWPNQLAKKNSEREDTRRVRRDLVIMSLISLVLLGLRTMEFGTLHVCWDQNAYGSIVWLLLGFHTAHLLTDAVDTIVLAVLMFTRQGHGKRFSDVGDNAFYWYFVAASWLPIYVTLYWLPRWW